MSFWNDLGTWFTGRNGIYKDDQLVDAAIDALGKINDDIAKNLDDPINKAISDLNAVKGMSEHVGTLNQGAFNDITICAADGIQAMIDQIETKKNDIDEYEKGDPVQHTIGTFSMATGKIVDGFVSVFEGLGDCALTGLNWACSAGTTLWDVATTDATMSDFGQKFDEKLNNSALKKAIEFDVSGTIASPLTDNYLAQKYSFFTKDSGAASICKGIGKTAGYMFIGGQLAGAARGAAGATDAMTVVNTGSKVLNALQSTTNATALMAGISGTGQGVETGLRSGKSFQASTVQGAIEGSIEAGTMYLAGKLGEHGQIKQAEKAYQAEVDKLTGAAKTSATNRMPTEMARIAENVHNAGGFTGQFTKNGLQTGFSAQQSFASTNGNIVTKTLAGAGKLVVEDGKTLMKDVKGAVKSNFSPDKFYEGGSRVTDKARIKEIQAMDDATRTAAGITSKTSLARYGTGIVKTAASPITAPIKGIVGGAEGMGTTITKASGAVWAQGAPAIGGNVTALGAEMALGGATNAVDRKTGIGSNSDIASQQFKAREDIRDNSKEVKPIDDPFNTGGNTSTPSNNNAATPSSNNAATPSSNNASTPSNNNSSTPSNDVDRDPSGPSGGGSDTQFRSPEYEPTPNASTNNISSGSNVATSNITSQNEPIPNSAANITFQNNTTSNTGTPTTQNIVTNTATGDTTQGQTIVTPAENTNSDNPTPAASVPTGEPSHTGGGYSNTGEYIPDDIPPEAVDEDSLINPEDITSEDYEEATDSITSIIGGDNGFTKLPTSNTAIKTSSSSGNAVIPVVAGLSAAAAAGLGAKAYLDRKNNNDNGESDFETEEWTGEDNLDIDYNDGIDTEQYLDDDSDYGTSETQEKYGARNNDELADLQ